MQRVIVTFLGKIETKGSIFRHETLIEVAAVRTTLSKFYRETYLFFLR